MPWKITIRKDLRIIQIESSGEVNVEDLNKSLEDVVKIRRERGFTRVFIDATKVTSVPSTLPIFKFASEVAATIQDVKFAIAKSPNLERDIKFIETVAVNRGAQVSVFDSEDAALAWLIEESNKADAADGK